MKVTDSIRCRKLLVAKVRSSKAVYGTLRSSYEEEIQKENALEQVSDNLEFHHWGV